MKVERVHVPFEPRNPKTRLSPALDSEERVELSYALLHDVCGAILDSGRTPIVVSTVEIDVEYEVQVKPEPLTPAVNELLENRDPPVAVVMADLALATPEALRRLYETEAELVLVPGLGGGTNAFVSQATDFRVDYHGASYRDHREIAKDRGIEVGVLDSYRLTVDVDVPEDFVEVLLHGDGAARDFLEERFELVVDEGRVSARRK